MADGHIGKMSVSQRDFYNLLSRVETLEAEIKAIREHLSKVRHTISPLERVGPPKLYVCSSKPGVDPQEGIPEPTGTPSEVDQGGKDPGQLKLPGIGSEDVLGIRQVEESS
jgi:hypothetical protein